VLPYLCYGRIEVDAKGVGIDSSSIVGDLKEANDHSKVQGEVSVEKRNFSTSPLTMRLETASVEMAILL
jgi:hypothetical protein